MRPAYRIARFFESRLKKSFHLTTSRSEPLFLRVVDPNLVLSYSHLVSFSSFSSPAPHHNVRYAPNPPREVEHCSHESRRGEQRPPDALSFTLNSHWGCSWQIAGFVAQFTFYSTFASNEGSVLATCREADSIACSGECAIG